MKLEELKELKLPLYKHDAHSMGITVGEAVAKAEISTTADAWVVGYSKGKEDNHYHHSFQVGVSQHEDSRFPGSKDQPKEFPVYIVGIVEEGKTHNLAYATSRNPNTKKITTLRLTNLDQITEIGHYTLILKKDK